MQPSDGRAPGSPARLIRPQVRDGPGHRRPSRPGPFLKRTEAPIPSPRSAANPASHPSLFASNSPRLLPCGQPARHRPVPGELPWCQRPRRADGHRTPRPRWPGSYASPAWAGRSASSLTVQAAVTVLAGGRRRPSGGAGAAAGTGSALHRANLARRRI